jgi:hypothetical protein
MPVLVRFQRVAQLFTKIDVAHQSQPGYVRGVVLQGLTHHLRQRVVGCFHAVRVGAENA